MTPNACVRSEAPCLAIGRHDAPSLREATEQREIHQAVDVGIVQAPPHDWAVSLRYMLVEKLMAMCNDPKAAVMIAAQRTSNTSYEEAAGCQFLHHVQGHCPAMSELYEHIAAAYVRGVLADAASGGIAGTETAAGLIARGRAAGLKLHRFKRTMGLPRVRAVLGVLRGIAPDSLVDIGSGCGVFLWPLLDAFPDLPVTAVEPDARRYAHIDAVRRGGLGMLVPVQANATALDYPAGSFDVVTLLEVLEHQADPAPLARAAVRLARRFAVASVPSKPDNNPEHVQMFDADSLTALLRDAGAANVRIDYVRNHIIAVARVARA